MHLVIALLLATTRAGAAEPSPEHAAQAKKVLGVLAYYADATKEACGLEPSIDWASFAAASRLDGPGSTIASACQGGLQGLAETCGASKERVTSKITSVVCTHVSTKAETGLFLDDRGLQIRVSIQDTGAGSAPATLMAPTRVDSLKWLEKHL